MQYSTGRRDHDMVKLSRPRRSIIRRKNLIYGFLSILVLLVAGAGLLLLNANRIIKHQLQQFLGNGFSVEDISFRWGEVRATDIRLLRPDSKEVLTTKNLGVRANIIGLLKKENIISAVHLDAPYLLLEVDKKGKIVPIMPARDQAPVKTQSRKKPQGRDIEPFLIKQFWMQEGSLDYLDRKVSPSPALIRMREIKAELKNFSVPPDSRVSDYEIDAVIPGKAAKGKLTSQGSINLKTKDTKSKLSIRDLDITQLRPYYEKKGDVEVTQGLLSLDAGIKVRDRRIQSEGTITIKDLEFKTSGGSFLGMPLLGVTKMLKDNRNQITLDFTLEGDLDNPKFNITQSLVQKLSLSLAKSLGMPIESMGRSVFDLGGSALKKLFE